MPRYLGLVSKIDQDSERFRRLNLNAPSDLAGEGRSFGGLMRKGSKGDLLNRAKPLCLRRLTCALR